MDREILFRGKRLDDGEWVEGCYVKTKTGQAYILPDLAYISFEYQTIAIGGFVEVAPSTVGQYTGLTDKNGKKIFVGDIVRWTWEPYVLVSPGGYYRYPYGSEFEVRLLESGFMLCKVGDQMPDIPNANGKVANYEFWNYHRGLEVIGNIHDNPELTGGEDDG